MRQSRFKAESSFSPGKKENVMKKLNNSKSRSPKGFHNPQFFGEGPERDITMKMGGQADGDVPAWYKTLKRHIGN